MSLRAPQGRSRRRGGMSQVLAQGLGRPKTELQGAPFWPGAPMMLDLLLSGSATMVWHVALAMNNPSGVVHR